MPPALVSDSSSKPQSPRVSTRPRETYVNHIRPALIASFLLAACSSDDPSDTTGDAADAGDTSELLDGDEDGSNGDTADNGDAGADGSDAGIDCVEAPPACVDDSACGDGQLCNTGLCVPASTRETFRPAGDLLEVVGVDFPAAGTTSGFDLDGDGDVDNVVAELLSALPAGEALIENVVNQTFADGVFNIAAEVRRDDAVCGHLEGSTAADIAFHFVTRDLDRDGLISESESEATSVVQVLPSGLTEDRGARCRMADGSYFADTQTYEGGGGVDCAFAFPLLDGTVISLPVRGVSLTTTLATLVDKDGEPAPNATVGGFVEVSALVAEANRVAPTCACAGIDTTAPIAETYADGDRLGGRCIQDVAGAETCPDTACANLPAVCASLTVLAFNADIQSGGEGAPYDSVSFGFGAIVEPVPVDPEMPVAPTLVAFGDHHGANRAYRIGPGVSTLSAAVLANDQYDPTLDSLQSLGAHTPSEVQLEAAIVGDRIEITMLEPWTETTQVEVTIPYTLGDGAERVATADLTFLISRITLTPEAIADSLDVRLGSGPQVLDLLGNDIAPEGAAIGVIGLALGEEEPVTSLTLDYGVVELADGVVTYEPTAMGYDSFVYVMYAWSPEGGSSESVRTEVSVRVDCPVDTYGPECVPCTAECGDRVCYDGMDGDGSCVCPDGSTEDFECGDSPVCTDGCRPYTCGDGLLQPELGEVCDPGAVGYDFCNTVCAWIPCGDDEIPRIVFRDSDYDYAGDPADPGSIGCPDDGFVLSADDCDDTDGTVYPGAREFCWDDRDNDCNADADCGDAFCTYDGQCYEHNCYGGEDNDRDGDIDCEDSDCRDSYFGACFEYDCDDSIDDDFDGLVDCRDSDCFETPACAESNCANGTDDNFDTLVDCVDPSCRGRDGCLEFAEELCGDSADNDEDGVVDCRDPDCRFSEECFETCDDEIDNNFDGLLDCADPGCYESSECYEYECGDGIDNDDDGLTDCRDVDCVGELGCSEYYCDPSFDDDGDGLFGCDDYDCSCVPG